MKIIIDLYPTKETFTEFLGFSPVACTFFRGKQSDLVLTKVAKAVTEYACYDQKYPYYLAVNNAQSYFELVPMKIRERYEDTLPRPTAQFTFAEYPDFKEFYNTYLRNTNAYGYVIRFAYDTLAF